MNDGIVDLESKRQHRPAIVIAALISLGLFIANLTAVVAVVAYTFCTATKPEAIAKSVAVELSDKLSKAASGIDAGASAASASEPYKKSTLTYQRAQGADKSASGVSGKLAEDQERSVKIEAKIFGEIKESLVPLVALVSILTVAAVVILGTLLKAAFAPHPNHKLDSKDEASDSSPVPVIEALKSLAEALKGLFSKG